MNIYTFLGAREGDMRPDFSKHVLWFVTSNRHRRVPDSMYMKI